MLVIRSKEKRVPVQRLASVIGLPAANAAEYERLHADVWPEVRQRLHDVGIRSYSIFRYGELLFSYMEYVGDDYERDMAALAADPRTQQWWAVTGPLQSTLRTSEQDEWWVSIPEVFHLT